MPSNSKSFSHTANHVAGIWVTFKNNAYVVVLVNDNLQ